MNYADATVVKLADPATRGALFDATALEQLLGAAYDVAPLGVTGPFSALFDDFRIGFAAAAVARLEGGWNPIGSPDRTEARFEIGGLSVAPTVRVDALWRGAIVARSDDAPSRVTSVSVEPPAFSGIDTEIVAALGALPVDPLTLETERRTRLRSRIAAVFDQPSLVTPERVDEWIRELGASSAGDLLSSFAGIAHGVHATVTFAAPVRGAPTPRRFPVSVALLVRDAGFSVTQVLWESRLVRERLEPAGVERPRNGGPRPRTALVVAWVVPAATFDDADWPGAAAGITNAQQRAARRAAAGAWLGREGIGLVVTA